MTAMSIRAAALALMVSLGAVSQVWAHCDTPEGPVIPAVHKALETKDLTPAMRWIKPEYEKEIKEAFNKALEVRKSGGAAQEMADQYFTETFVRLHRAGEGEPYTGIKPAGGDPGPAVTAADASLNSGNDEALVKLMKDAVGKAVQERFAKAREAKAHADQSVDAGRAYVEAYVGLTHFVERVYAMTEEQGHGAGHAAPPADAHAGQAHAAPPARDAHTGDAHAKPSAAPASHAGHNATPAKNDTHGH